MSYEAWGDGDEQFDTWAEKASEHGWYSPDDLSRAEKDVIRERERQVDEEAWSPAHDDEVNASGELAWAAACYAIAGGEPNPAAAVVSQEDIPHALWPWPLAGFKPKDRRSDLVRAAALLIAEIERLDRAQQSTAEAKE